MNRHGSEQNFDPSEFPHQIRTTTTFDKKVEVDTTARKKLLESLEAVLRQWDVEERQGSAVALPIVKRIAQIMEEGYIEFLKKDPDPLDDRHPHRTHPAAAFGHLLKILFRHDDFMNKLVISYILGRDDELSTQSCRLLLNCIPGLDSNVVFSEPDDFVPRLYQWARDSTNECRQAYAMGLLAAVLEVQDNAVKYRAENAQLVPIALQRLKELKDRHQKQFEIENVGPRQQPSEKYPYTNFSHLVAENAANQEEGSSATEPTEAHPPMKKRKIEEDGILASTSMGGGRIPSFSSLLNLDNSNSKWDILQPFLIGTHQVYPMTTSMYQRLILQFLGPTGEYQDLLSMTYEGNALDLIMDYIDLEKAKDVRLTFDALKYLTSLLVHRKFALEFVARDGVQALLQIPRTSLASVGVVTSLYYIAYNSDVMETVCQLKDEVVGEVVDYVLWCLEHSHESGMASAAMFFAHAVYYKKILEKFDELDGARKLCNYLSTLSMLQEGAADESFALSEEQIHTSTQCVRNACNALRSYTAAHLFVKLETIRKSLGHKHFVGMSFPSSLMTDTPAFKSMKIHEEHIWECQKVLVNINRLTNGTWKPIELLKRFGAIRLMISVHVLSRDWNPSTSGKSEMSINALEVMAICSCLTRCQMELLETYTHVHFQTEGITALFETALGEEFDDEGSVRIAALKVLIIGLSVHSEVYKKMDVLPPKVQGRRSKLVSTLPARTHLDKMWAAARKADGIMILIELINAKLPITDADVIRTHACHALAGMARNEQVRQLLSKLPIIANNVLQVLMREPVAEDKRVEHAEFCRKAMELLQIVTGKNMQERQAKDLTQEKMHKHWIVENTKISYNEKELLQCIQEHLIRKGLTGTAALLRHEAELPDMPASRVPPTPVKLNPLPKNGTSYQQLSIKPTCKSASPPLEPLAEFETSSVLSNKRPTSANASTSSSGETNVNPNDAVFATPTTTRNTGKSVANRSSAAFPKKFYISPMKPKISIQNTENQFNVKPYRTLDDILTEYFRQQHSHCNNPVTTCPPFSLYYPHKCPETSSLGRITSNIAHRLSIRDIGLQRGRMPSTWQDERYVFGRFRPSRIIHEHEETYSCSAFSIDDEHLIIGVFSGEVHWMNVETGNDESVTTCHNSAITHIEPSSDGTMLLTSSAYVRPLSALWKLGHAMERVRYFKNDSFVKFSNLSLDRIIGTYAGTATVYDTETGHALSAYESQEFEEPRHSRNMASFSPCDQLVLNDGMLWDVRTPNDRLHVFDKLNQSTLNGVFHPHGNQIIINTEVFDIRNYRVLHHVPALDQCRVTFNATGNMMYAAVCEEVEQVDMKENPASSSFRTFDTLDYSVISTMDMKKPIIGLSASNGDHMMAVIEKLKTVQNEFSMQSASQVKIFDVGKLKDAEDDADEGDEDDEENDNNDDDEEGSTSSEDTFNMGTDDDDDDMDDDDDDDIGSSMSENEIGVFEAIGRLGALEDDLSIDGDDDYDDEESDEEEEENENVVDGRSSPSDTDDDDRSSGWRTLSENDNPQDMENIDENQENGDGDDQDSSYEPEQDDYNSTSSTALNPHLRRRNQSDQ